MTSVLMRQKITHREERPHAHGGRDWRDGPQPKKPATAKSWTGTWLLKEKEPHLLPTMLLLCPGARHEELASNSRTCKGVAEAGSQNSRITGQSASPRNEAKETQETQVPEVFRSAPTGVWGDGSSWMSTYLSAKEQEDGTWVEKAKKTTQTPQLP